MHDEETADARHEQVVQKYASQESKKKGGNIPKTVRSCIDLSQHSITMENTVTYMDKVHQVTSRCVLKESDTCTISNSCTLAVVTTSTSWTS